MRADFKYKLGERVKIGHKDAQRVISDVGERGVILGRAEYADGTPHQYQVGYYDGHNCYVRGWFSADEIQR